MSKTIIITGAAGNLGKAVTKKFIDGGYKVIAADGAAHIAGIMPHPDLEAKGLNAADEKEAENFVQEIINKYGTIDAALLLIGGFAMGSIEDAGGEELQKMFSLNFNTAYFTARPVFKQMLKQPQGGKIIFMAAASALDEKQGYKMLPYVLSKSLIVKLAKTLNNEGQKKNIHCSVIAPTTIDTPQNRTSIPDADFSKWTKAEEIADVMEFIISEKGDKMKDVVIKM